MIRRSASRFSLSAVVALHLALAAPATPAAEDREPAVHGGDDDATVHHSFEDPERWSRVFDAPDRFEWQQPGIVLRVLGVDEGHVVADLGAGTGFFTVYLSSGVGASGKVYAVDVEPKLLEHILQREDRGTDDNIVTILAAPDDPKLPAGELDLILTVDTWHHIDDRLVYLPKLARALKPGGRLALIDFVEGELPVGPPPGHKLPRAAVIAELEGAGWRLVTESVALPYQYFLVFEPPAAG